EVFLSNGGSLTGIGTAQGVITELKRAAAKEMQIVGLRGSVVDLRLQAVEETDGEQRERAIWNSGLSKFVINESTSGVREFILNDELADVDYRNVTRSTSLIYNDTDGWVWDTNDFNFATSTGPSSVPTTGGPAFNLDGQAGSANRSKLKAPLVSPGSATLALADFPLEISMAKQEGDPYSTRIYYSVEPNVWVLYTAPFEVEQGTTIQAYTIHEDTKFERSDLASASYDCTPEDLKIVVTVKKNPVTYAEAGGPLEDGDYTPVSPLEPIDVLLDTGTDIPLEYQDSDHFQISWTYDGSNPLTSSTSVDGIKFTNGYGNNGHGNNFGGIDFSNPAWQQEALESGMTQEEIDEVVRLYDLEMKPHDEIGYTIENWDGLTLLPVRVVARSKNANVVTNSMVHSANITVSRMTLPAPNIVFDGDSTRRGDIVEINKVVDGGEMPVGARIYYTTDGTDPGDDGKGNPLTGTLYTGPFDPLLEAGVSLEANIVARVYPPESYGGWFNVSPPSNSPYSIPESESVEDPDLLVDSWW
ncbi:MAG: hypothetical protein ACR2RV_03355, partial [Verrucomicrobiales bacterium]